ncbi:hypothetical protein EVJ58_g2784 [Rhodofomes roseus]|uniref:Uncharacterized protein n=1 Tax=Rhodofomes roseus TaxID=34475 RepID=A0A4Y9YR74_9APHY|nr:hypothetical protein EVJ58_g2784 [Rhodofomes roseus]
MPHLAHTYHRSELAAQYAGMNRDVVRVDVRVSGAALGRLVDVVRARTRERAVSRQDCLTAYVVTVLNRCGAGSIDVVANAASYRNIAAPWVDAAVAGNPIYIVRTDLGRGAQRLSDIALTIRRSIEKWREPAFIGAHMSVASQLMLDAANARRSMFFAAEPGVLSVNSNLSLDWQSADFGYPSRARFHTSGINERYLRTFHVNPNPKDHGQGENIEMSFGVSASLRDKVVDMLATELDSPAFPVNLDVL